MTALNLLTETIIDRNVRLGHALGWCPKHGVTTAQNIAVETATGRTLWYCHAEYSDDKPHDTHDFRAGDDFGPALVDAGLSEPHADELLAIYNDVIGGQE